MTDQSSLPHDGSMSRTLQIHRFHPLSHADCYTCAICERDKKHIIHTVPRAWGPRKGAPAKGPWTRVEDELPPYGKEVIAAGKDLHGEPWVAGGVFCDEWPRQLEETESRKHGVPYWQADEGRDVRGVTHWTHLPAPPQEGE